ncbi:MAG: homoserine dehydrogenase, partial [Isosphaeraceae bacterium]
MERLAVGLLGVGTVGSGVVRLLDEHGDRVARRAGCRVEIRRAVVRDTSRSRGASLRGVEVSTDPWQVIRDPEIDVVVETMGGTDPTLKVVLDALAAGKHVVTANKALLAEHGPEVFAAARKYGRAVAFEASVAGGIPIV